MATALALAERGRGRTFPNPNVGCVVVRDGRVVGRGWTQPGGRPHAEAMALAQAGASAEGADIYVTLEPCAHVSARGPACADLLVAARPRRIIAALQDPDPRTAGGGFERLRDSGIGVVTGIATAEAERVMAGFLTRRRLGRPHVTLKLATSLDGRIALTNGSSRWITGEAARAHAHLERARAEAIVVGRGTYAADAPTLDVRLPGLEDRSPMRFMLSKSVRHPRESGDDERRVLAAPHDVADIPADHILVEGGARTAAAFLAADLVDRLLLYRAPIIIGDGKPAIADIGLTGLDAAHGRWRLVDTRAFPPDRLDIHERVRAPA